MPMLALYKVGWQSPRFWEKENNIYGGISFLHDVVDLVWYPTANLFSPTGVLVAGFGSELQFNSHGWQRRAITLRRAPYHRGQARRLSQSSRTPPTPAAPTCSPSPSTSTGPGSLTLPAASPIISSPAASPPMYSWKSRRGKPTSPVTTSLIWSAGRRARSSPPITPSSASRSRSTPRPQPYN